LIAIVGRVLRPTVVPGTATRAHAAVQRVGTEHVHVRSEGMLLSVSLLLSVSRLPFPASAFVVVLQLPFDYRQPHTPVMSLAGGATAAGVVVAVSACDRTIESTALRGGSCTTPTSLQRWLPRCSRVRAAGWTSCTASRQAWTWRRAATPSARCCLQRCDACVRRMWLMLVCVLVQVQACVRCLCGCMYVSSSVVGGIAGRPRRLR
jgi:hypothetical protein